MTGEAVALIGAHTIGKVRVEFGPGEAGPWVPGGDDAATSNGPSECLLFDFAYDLQLVALAILTKTYLL